MVAIGAGNAGFLLRTRAHRQGLLLGGLAQIGVSGWTDGGRPLRWRATTCSAGVEVELGVEALEALGVLHQLEVPAGLEVHEAGLEVYGAGLESFDPCPRQR